MTMQKYSDYRPTGFDAAGLNLPDRQDWRVLPLLQTRDSGTLARSNVIAAREMLGDGDDVEIHSFGHWACGWFEIIIVRPDSPAEVIARDICQRLEDYPVLDDDRHSEMEWDEHIQDVETACEQAAWDDLSEDFCPETVAQALDWNPGDAWPHDSDIADVLVSKGMLAADD